MKNNRNMLKGRNFFNDVRRKGKYVAYRKLTRKKFTPQQVHDTITRMRADRKARMTKRLIAYGIVMVVFITLLVLINKRVLF